MTFAEFASWFKCICLGGQWRKPVAAGAGQLTPKDADAQRRRAIERELRVEEYRQQMAKQYDARYVQVPMTAPGKLSYTLEPQDVCPAARDEALDKSRWIQERLRLEQRERLDVRKDMDVYGASGLGTGAHPDKWTSTPPASNNVEEALLKIHSEFGRYFKRPWDNETKTTHTQITTPVDFYGRPLLPMALVPHPHARYIENLRAKVAVKFQEEQESLREQGEEPPPPPSMEPEREVQLRAVFELVDKNQDGVITRTELVRALRSEQSVRDLMGLEAFKQGSEGHTVFEEKFQWLDEDANKEISWPEFAALA
eukprot:TRINITY_DN25967_c0_g1_i1.p1 TRINITY_DN25967_c0_g1~~TRINITY_DN25967_c0_g1_i1.p1  ORF type:complete len:312 (+),score=74.10 TRINITY_DN25967_c0_g1_i1:200-1135(+)